MPNPVATIEFDVTYQEPCPECAKSGNPDVPVGFSMANGISCATGAHRFDTVPGEAQNPQEAPTGTPGKPQAAAVTISGLTPMVEKVPNPADGPTPEQKRQWAQEDMQERMREAARRGIANMPAVPAIPKELKPEAVVPNGKPVQVLDSTPAPGNEITVTITMRERHVTAIMAEAEVQDHTFSQELQEFVERALDNFWGLV